MNGPLNAPCSCGQACDCGCCEGTEPLTPQPIANRPGLDALYYRVGTHSTFLETMKARLSSNDFEALGKLTTREADDVSIALLDSWAVVADVLTFYQERIANEGYLRTATERRSVLELARLVGYAPRPGVAASTYLAYTLDPGPEALIPAGAAARSVPGPGEMPQTFETSEDLTARAEWNNLQVRLTRPQQPIDFNPGVVTVWPASLYLKGINTQLKPNDPLLIDIGTENAPVPFLYRVLAVKPDTANDRTQAKIEPWLKPLASTSFQPSATPVTDVSPLRTITAEPGISLSKVRETVERARNQEDLKVPVSARSVVARVNALLDRLNEDLDAGVGEAELQSRIEEVIPKLREETGSAKKPRSQSLIAWIDGTATDLESALEAPSAPLEFRMAFADSDVAAASNPGDPAKKTTEISEVLGSLGKAVKPQLRNSTQLNRSAASLLSPGSDLSAKLLTVAKPELRNVLYAAWANVPVTEQPRLKVYALRLRASAFGHNAPLELYIPPNQTGSVILTQTREWTILVEEPRMAWTDTAYPQILPESWIVLQRPSAIGSIPELVITRVERNNERSRASYGVSAKVSRIALQDPWLDLERSESAGRDNFATIRGTAIFAQSEELALAEAPIPKPLCGGEVELAALYDGLQPGRWLIVSGERSDVGPLDEKGNVTVPVPGIMAAELVMLAGVSQDVQKSQPATSTPTGGVPGNDVPPAPIPGERTHTTLTLEKPLAYCYKRDSIRIYGNVVRATHGETRYEVLGSGDAAKAFQAFTLKQPPLTWVSAPTPSGVESTLKVWVNDILWHLSDSLAGLGPTDRSYILRTDDGGQTTVVFGNGERGARLPTGAENLRATYRSGIGKGGNVKKEQISQLATRPLGVKDVINPLPASGGADRESRDQARRNAPLAVLALDRLISVQDYADFARTFAGVGKASAVRLTDGRVQLVHVTIAGEDDIPIRTDSDLFLNLEAALRRFGEPRQPLRLEVRQRTFLVVEAEVKILPDYLWEAVEPKIRAAMLVAFGFDRRDLGQDALLSEVYRVIQGVRGVDLVDVNLFARRDPEDLLASLEIGEQRLRARLARIDDQGKIQPAQLLYLTPEVADTLILKERKS